MSSPKKSKFIFLAVLAVFLTALGGVLYNFLYSVQQSLWDNSIKNIMESTARGAHGLQNSYLKDLDMLRMLADELEQTSSEHEDRIRRKLKIFLSHTGSISSLIFEDGTGYIDSGIAVSVTPEEKNFIRSLKESGVIEPHINRSTGRRTLVLYTAVHFQNGRRGYLFKGYNVENLYTEYALSFYNNTGFSYIVTPQGEIIMRSVHPASNRISANIFDVISSKNNNPAVVESFRSSLLRGKTGVAVLNTPKGENVFCYVPMPKLEGWYVISSVPNREIMREVTEITKQTLFISLLVLCGCLVAFLIYLRMNRSHQQEIYSLSYTDRLTGIGNFAKFREDTGRALKAPNAPAYAVLSMDISNFKLFNDIMGFDTGDDVLRRFAALLKEKAPSSALVARMSADNFLVLFPYEERDEVSVYCRIVEERLNTFIPAGPSNYRLKLHAGICCVEDNETYPPEVNALLDRAFIAKKNAREKMERSIFYDRSIRATLLQEKELEMHMEQALNSGEFLVYIQPKINISRRGLAGGEALVRWKNAEQRFIPPGEFIPLFEKNQFIAKLDQYIFASVCALQRRWLDMGLTLPPISVNVSRVQLYSSEFVDTYIRIKKQFSIPDGLLELEFTESIFFENVTLLVETAQRLRQAGFLCSIDDFGSGYSSLNLLRELIVDTLKLDRAFFHANEANDRDRIVIRSIIQMAHELNMQVVAEGVENRNQLDFLTSIDCDMVQGYVFSRPVPAEEFADMLANPVNWAHKNWQPA